VSSSVGSPLASSQRPVPIWGEATCVRTSCVGRAAAVPSSCCEVMPLFRLAGRTQGGLFCRGQQPLGRCDWHGRPGCLSPRVPGLFCESGLVRYIMPDFPAAKLDIKLILEPATPRDSPCAIGSAARLPSGCNAQLRTSPNRRPAPSRPWRRRYRTRRESTAQPAGCSSWPATVHRRRCPDHQDPCLSRRQRPAGHAQADARPGP
jgi:hypothetical protein